MRKRDIVLDEILDGVADGFDMEGGYHETGQCNSSRCEACARERAEASKPITMNAGDVTVEPVREDACDECGCEPITNKV